MLVLACTLRVQRSVIRHRPRPAVAEATPVLQVYGTVPIHEDVEESSGGQRPDSVRPDMTPAFDDTEASQGSSSIEVEIIATTGWSPRASRSATVTAQPISTSVPIVIAERIGETLLVNGTPSANGPEGMDEVRTPEVP